MHGHAVIIRIARLQRKRRNEHAGETEFDMPVQNEKKDM